MMDWRSRLNALPDSQTTRAVIVVFGLVTTMTGIVYGFAGLPTPAATLIGLGLAAFFVANLQRYKKFSLPGISGELADKVNETAAELDKLKSLTAQVARSTYFAHTYGNRMMAHPLAMKVRMLGDMDKLLDELDINSAEIREYRDKFISFHMYDGALFLRRAIDRRAGVLVDLANKTRSADPAQADGLMQIYEALQVLKREPDFDDFSASPEHALAYFKRLRDDITAINFSIRPSEQKVLPKLVMDVTDLFIRVVAKRRFDDEVTSEFERFSTYEPDPVLKTYVEAAEA